MTAKKLIKIIFVSVIVIIVVGYTYYQSHNVIIGPQLKILSPANGSSTTEAFVLISGKVKNVSNIHVDDRPIFISTDGKFTDAIILHPGYNIITIKAEGKFGRITEKTLELIAKNDSVKEIEHVPKDEEATIENEQINNEKSL